MKAMTARDTAFLLPSVTNQKRFAYEDRTMWNWFNCYLSGRHEFVVWCEPGAVFLRCAHCGRRSSGWAIDATRQTPPAVAHARSSVVSTTGVTAAPHVGRVLPFDRAAAR